MGAEAASSRSKELGHDAHSVAALLTPMPDGALATLSRILRIATARVDGDRVCSARSSRHLERICPSASGAKWRLKIIATASGPCDDEAGHCSASSSTAAPIRLGKRPTICRSLYKAHDSDVECCSHRARGGVPGSEFPVPDSMPTYLIVGVSSS